MKKHVFYWLALALIIVVGCQRETSFELGNTPAQGSLQSDVTGDCLPKSVNGVYEAETPLVPAANTITVSVTVTRTGIYVITTDTVNGYYFRATGTFTTLGPTNVTLRGNGTPFIDGTDNFVVSYNGTICDIAVDVVPAGTNVPAVFTLNGAPGNCTGAVVTGSYALTVPLNPATNTVTINVMVTTIGTYNISTTFQGMTFARIGTFTTPGANSVTLAGTGTPTTAGNNNVPITVGATTCNFIVPVGSPVVFTLAGSPGNCTTPTIAGTYTVGVPLTAANTVTLSVTVTTAGVYGVTLPTVQGITFAGSGTLAAGPQTIVLTATGTPTTSGPNVFTITVPGSNCSFTIPVGAGGSAYIPDCSSIVPNPDGVYEPLTPLTDCNTIEIDVDVTALGPYSITATTTNGFSYTASGTFTALGATTITLVGSGTPVALGNTTVSMPGSTPCTFTIAVVPPFGPIEWSFRVTNAPATTYQGQHDFSEIVQDPPTAPAIGLTMLGSNSLASDDFEFAIVDANGTITAGETYSTATAAAFFYGSGCSTEEYSSDPTTIGFVMVFTVVNHNVAAQTITGTFSGTAKNLAGQPITITNGTFTAHY